MAWELMLSHLNEEGLMSKRAHPTLGTANYVRSCIASVWPRVDWTSLSEGEIQLATTVSLVFETVEQRRKALQPSFVEPPVRPYEEAELWTGIGLDDEVSCLFLRRPSRDEALRLGAVLGCHVIDCGTLELLDAPDLS